MSKITGTSKGEELIRNHRKVNRAISFAGLNRGKGMNKDSVFCSDIDSVMEFNDKYLILIEIKEHGMEIKTGQRLMLERIASAWANSGPDKDCIVLHATHDPGLLDIVPVSECTVQGCYLGSRGRWSKGVPPINLIDCLHRIGDRYNIPKLKKQ